MLGFLVSAFLRNVEREVEYSDVASCPLASRACGIQQYNKSIHDSSKLIYVQ